MREAKPLGIDVNINKNYELDSGFHSRLRKILEGERSSSAFAKRAGLSQSGFHRIENGGEPTLKTIISIAKAANVSVHWLITGEAETEPGPEFVQSVGRIKRDEAEDPLIDKWLLSRAIDEIRHIYKRVGGQISTVGEVDLGVDIHNRIVPLVKGREARQGALIIALDQLEKDLLAVKKTKGDDDKRTA